MFYNNIAIKCVSFVLIIAFIMFELLASHLAIYFKPHSPHSNQNHIDLVKTFLLSPLPMTIPAKYTTSADVSNIIKNLTHPDMIKSQIKSLKTSLLNQIFGWHIFYVLHHISYFPPTWKHFIIMIILRTGKPSISPTLYRLISLLPAFGKMFEKLY